MTDVNNAAESSAVAIAEPEFNPQDQHTWSPEQREHWNKTGDIPASPKKQESEPAASSAKATKSEPEGKNAAESETASKQGKRERKPGEKVNADERIAQLVSKVKELEERERSRAAETKPPSEEKPTAALDVNQGPQAPERPKRPKLSEFPNYEAYEAQMEKYEDQLIEYPAKRQAFEAAKAEFDKQQARFTERQKDVRAKWDSIAAKAKEIYSEDEFNAVRTSYLGLKIPDGDPVEQYVRESEPEIAAHLLKYFGLKADDLKRITKLSARQQYKELEALETAMREELAPGKKGESKPPAELKPRAPKPPSEVGGRGAAGEDALRAAASSGDFRAFEAEESRRKFAKAS